MKWFKIRFLSISSTVSSTGQMHTDSRKGLGWGRYENLVTISKKHKRGTFHIFYTYSLSSQICRQNSCWSWRILCREIRFLKVLNKFKISPSIGQLCCVSFHFFYKLRPQSGFTSLTRAKCRRPPSTATPTPAALRPPIETSWTSSWSSHSFQSSQPFYELLNKTFFL
jgi:hypothetical protein